MQFLSAWVPVPELSLWCSTELVPILCNTFLYWAEKNCMWHCRCSVDAELFEWEEESYLCWVGWIPCNKSPGCHWPSALQGHILNSYSACLPALLGFRGFSKNSSNQLTPICVLVQGLIWSLVHLPVLNFWVCCSAVHLNSSPALQCIDYSSQHHIVHRLSFCPVLQAVNEGVKQSCPQYHHLWAPLSSHLPAGFHTGDEAPLSSQFSAHHIIYLSGQNLSKDTIWNKDKLAHLLFQGA